MLKKSMKDFFEKEGLIDIAKNGVARQSSVSIWSNINDAYGAINGNVYEDFAFHTDKQQNPWWEIEFPTPRFIQYVVINNRKREPFDKIASRIIVEIIGEDGDSTIIHKGKVLFGSLPNSIPLIMKVDSDLKIKKIIISLPEYNYLHLGTINIFAPIIKDEKRILFVSNRTDGLGERIKAILNSIVLSKKFDGDFLFTWDSWLGGQEYHDTDKAENIFRRAFIDKHLIKGVDLEALNLQPIKQLKELNEINNLDFDGILVQQMHIESQINDKNIRLQGTDYKNAFDSIDFSENLEFAKKEANKVDIREKTIAIHLRAGDIVFGHYRFTNNFYTKVIPIHIVCALIVKLIELNYRIIIFGQDYSFCRFLTERYNILYSGDLVKSDFNDTQKAFFDIVLMSKCSNIIAGSSGFAILASWINNCKIDNYLDYLSDCEVLESYRCANLENGILNSNSIQPLMKSFSMFHFFLTNKKDILLDEKIDLLKKIVKLDSKNSYYKVILAAFLYENNEVESADKMLIEEFMNNKDYDIRWVLEKSHYNVSIIQEYIEYFKFAADKGSLLAATMLLLYERFSLDSVNLTYYKDVLDKSHTNTFGFYLLKKELNNLV